MALQPHQRTRNGENYQTAHHSNNKCYNISNIMLRILNVNNLSGSKEREREKYALEIKYAYHIYLPMEFDVCFSVSHTLSLPSI